ncbi:MAG: pre-16S rRNA-processing nuclease YqgF [Acidaminococcaceae bacterium]
MNKLILGVDPGRSKTGVALTDSAGQLLRLDVLLMDDFEEGLRDFLQDVVVSLCLIGDGTTTASMQQTLKELLAPHELLVVPEANSTQEARKLYWQMHPPQGWRRLLPLGLQTPPVNLDGYAAFILIKRYLARG